MRVPTRAYACWPRKQFDRAVVAAKLTGGPHKLRHTLASHFLAKHPDVPLLARLLAHNDVRVTERVYAPAAGTPRRGSERRELRPARRLSPV